MKLDRNAHERVDAAFKVAGLVLLAVGIEFVVRGDLLLAAGFLGAGSLSAIFPLYIEVE